MRLQSNTFPIISAYSINICCVSLEQRCRIGNANGKYYQLSLFLSISPSLCHSLQALSLSGCVLKLSQANGGDKLISINWQHQRHNGSSLCCSLCAPAPCCLCQLSTQLFSPSLSLSPALLLSTCVCIKTATCCKHFQTTLSQRQISASSDWLTSTSTSTWLKCDERVDVPEWVVLASSLATAG